MDFVVLFYLISVWERTVYMKLAIIVNEIAENSLFRSVTFYRKGGIQP